MGCPIKTKEVHLDLILGHLLFVIFSLLKRLADVHRLSIHQVSIHIFVPF